MVVKGVSATGKQSDIRLPISLKLLHEMWGTIPFIVASKFDAIMYRSLLSFTFHGLFRPGEVTYSPHVIKAENVYFVEHQLQVHLKSSKSHRGPGSQVVTIDKQPGVCPVTDLRLYLTVQPWILGALYRKQSGLPVQYNDFLRLMNNLATFCDLPKDRFKPHSLRIGSTTHLHLQGYESQVLQRRGRWSSKAFLRYIRV